MAQETGIQIQVSDNGTDGWADLAGSPFAADSVAAAHTGLTAATLKYYRARAIGNGTTTSDSDWSAVVNATTQAGGGSQLATPTDLQVRVDGKTQLTPNWLHSPNATTYQVLRNTTNDLGTATSIFEGSKINLEGRRWHQDLGLTQGTTYHYWIIAKAAGYTDSAAAYISGTTRNIDLGVVQTFTSVNTTTAAKGFVLDNGRRVFYTLDGANLKKLNATTMAVEATLALTQTTPAGVWYDAMADKIYCVHDSNMMTEVDAVTFTQTTVHTMAGLTNGQGIVGSSTNNKLWISKYNAEIREYDLTTKAAIQTLDVAGNFFLTQLQYHEPSNRIYTADYNANNTMWIVDPATNTWVAEVLPAQRRVVMLATEVNEILLLGPTGGGQLLTFDTLTTIQPTVAGMSVCSSGCHDPVANAYFAVDGTSVKKLAWG